MQNFRMVMKTLKLKIKENISKMVSIYALRENNFRNILFR